MKLSEIRGEGAIELLGDILIPVTEIMADPKVSSAVESGKPKLIIATIILKNHAKSILTILALLNQEDPETCNPSLLALPKMVMDLLNDEELMNLFHSQSQLKEDESSASASENIAE
jgi:hypothetical protein